MKTIRVFVGLFCVVLSLLLLFQSCAAKSAWAAENVYINEKIPTTLHAVFLLAAGTIAIIGKKSRTAAILCSFIYFTCGFIGVFYAMHYPKFIFWNWLNMVFAVFFLLSAIIDQIRRP